MSDEVRDRTCPAKLNIKGEHFSCEQMLQMAPERDNHDGWAHSNRAAEAIWCGNEGANDTEAAS